MKRKLTLIIFTVLVLLIGKAEALTLTQKLGDEYIVTTVEQGDEVEMTFTSKVGFKFKNWVVTGASVADTSSETINFTINNQNVTVEGKYTEKYTVTFNANGGEGSMSNQSIPALSSKNLTQNAFTRENHNFLGWAESEDGDKKYDDQESITPTSDLNLYAVWEEGSTVAWNEPTGIGNGLTPVRWTGSAWEEATDAEIANGTWKTWYNYETANDENGNHITTLANGDKTAMWANAVTEDGSQWVWIPRYSYKITNGYNNSGTSWNNGGGASGNKIEIIFSNGTDDTDETGYTPHPAFDFGGDVDGIWVAKYEMSAEKDGAEYQPGDILTSANSTVKMVSKEGRTSWKSICVSNIFDNTLAYNSDLESHMMKNVEWGAVAYLSNAIGRIPAINSSGYVSGAGGVTTSTTGNEYGIYDMSGGSYEYVAAYLDYNADSSTKLGGASAGTYAYSLYTNRDTKYVDTYTPNSSNYAWTASEIGDAVYETSDTSSGSTSWDGDYSGVPNSNFPVFRRGGIYADGSDAGVFYFSCNDGNARSSYGFRAVLVP